MSRLMSLSNLEPLIQPSALRGPFSRVTFFHFSSSGPMDQTSRRVFGFVSQLRSDCVSGPFQQVQLCRSKAKGKRCLINTLA